MRTRLFGLFAGFLAILVGTPTSAFAQGKTSFLFDGVVLTGKAHFFGPNTTPEARNILEHGGPLEAKNRLFPGIELRFNQSGRLTFGVGVQRWNLEKFEHFSYIYPDGGEYRYDRIRKADGEVVTGTLYVNLLTRGPARPFVGVGSGIALLKGSRTIANIVDKNQSFPDSIQTADLLKAVVKGVAGLNVYPTKHLVLSLGGGYINGPALTLGAGFTF
jgi:opacity protein-like surface antigen